MPPKNEDADETENDTAEEKGSGTGSADTKDVADRAESRKSVRTGRADKPDSDERRIVAEHFGPANPDARAKGQGPAEGEPNEDEGDEDFLGVILPE